MYTIRFSQVCSMKTYSIDITGIFPLIEREISRIAAASYSEDGGSLYDVIKITSRDKQIIEDMIELRKIQLAKKLRFASVKATRITGENLTDETKGYNISFSVSDKFDITLTEDTKMLILNYLTKGVTLDWCNKKGVPTTEVTSEAVFQIEDDLISLLRSPSYLKVPLQPFGPRK